MKKSFYQVIFNLKSKPDKTHRFEYKYDKTNITLELSEDFIDISMSMKKRDINFGNIFNSKGNGVNKRLNDAIEKAFLIHLIKYSRHISIRTVTAKIGKKRKTIFDAEKNDSEIFPIFSLINGSLLKGHEFPERWEISQELCEAILSRRKSYFNSLDSALFALVYSKSKEYETERLVYLWMAINGMYNHFAKMAEFVLKHTFNKNKTISGDKDQMQELLKFYGLGKNLLSKNPRTAAADDVISVLRDYEGNITKEMLIPDENNNYNNPLAVDIYSKLKDIKTEDNKQYEITPYGFLLFELPYYYRCKIFHANKPIYFFSYEDEVRCLQIINNLMEEFVQTHLIEWFEDGFVTAVDNKANKSDIKEIDSPIKKEIEESFKKPTKKKAEICA